jgi:prolyl-tRNA editing enzyme YbaK/EbsC (Cys-tRNA(Pro) deacylase)
MGMPCQMSRFSDTEKAKLVSENQIAKRIPEKKKASIREDLDVLTGGCNTFRTPVAGQWYNKRVLADALLQTRDSLTNTLLV